MQKYQILSNYSREMISGDFSCPVIDTVPGWCMSPTPANEWRHPTEVLTDFLLQLRIGATLQIVQRQESIPASGVKEEVEGNGLLHSSLLWADTMAHIQEDTESSWVNQGSVHTVWSILHFVCSNFCAEAQEENKATVTKINLLWMRYSWWKRDCSYVH